MERLVEASLRKRASAEPLQQWTNQYFKQLGKRGRVLDTLNQMKKQSTEGNYKDQLEYCVRKVIDAIFE